VFAVRHELKLTCLNIKIKQQPDRDWHLGFAYLMPDCWLEVSLHPEGPATDQLDQGFPWFSSMLEQMLSWYTNSHFAVQASHAALPFGNIKILPLAMLDHISV
jgi:hypothetical protein